MSNGISNIGVLSTMPKDEQARREKAAEALIRGDLNMALDAICRLPHNKIRGFLSVNTSKDPNAGPQ